MRHTFRSRTPSFTLRAGASLLTLLCSLSPTVSAAPQGVDPRIEAAVKTLAAELKAACPAADPGDQAAFNRCRQTLFKDSYFRQMLMPITLWGRQRNPDTALDNTNLTQFAPDVLTGMYVPLFMFDGNYKIDYVEKEAMYRVTLNAGFRNRLQPGQFPYPFWHEADKWNTYQDAKSVLLWVLPFTGKVRTAQFSARGEGIERPGAVGRVERIYEGKWLWTDDKGATQPAATLFDGLFRDDNPYKRGLDASYREFAVTLRESQCLSCHTPNNPQKLSRLVLLQTPAHAAAEIERVLRDVRENKMPIDEFGIEKTLDAHGKQALLDKGEAFKRLVEQARAWEKRRAQKNG